MRKINKISNVAQLEFVFETDDSIYLIVQKIKGIDLK
jgi:hypothetical protein